MVGGLVGALPLQPRQSGQLGLPLLLAPEETSLLLDKGIYTSVCIPYQRCPHSIPGVLELKQDTPPSSGDDIVEPELESRVTVFRDLWGRGFTITSGLKYGADYLVYKGDPALVHSCFLALVLPWKQPVETLMSLCRVGSKVAKAVLLCSAERGCVQYQTLEWDPV